MSDKSPAAYDVIVVGARCAGAPVAMLLAGKGHRVLLLELGALLLRKDGMPVAAA